MSDKKISCCFTGHRNINMSNTDSLKNKLEAEIVRLIKIGYKNFFAGGALGFDTLCAKTVIDLKKIYPDISLTLALPCLEQSHKWSYEDKFIYENIKFHCDDIVYVSEHYTASCMHKRNRYMVDNSSAVICFKVYDRGGTFYTVNYAMSKNVPVINVAD